MIDDAQEFGERFANSLISMFARRPYAACWPGDAQNIADYIASELRAGGWKPDRWGRLRNEL